MVGRLAEPDEMMGLHFERLYYERFVFVARARNTGLTGFGRPRHYLTDMLAMSEADARLSVYAPDPGVAVEEVGPACRICPRRACPHRVEDPLTG